ncbi:MAG: hypothetical protein ABW136_04935 [Steroidobacteraceae bacterium]
MRNAHFLPALLLATSAFAQVQSPINQVPAGEGRLPTETSGAASSKPGGDDCRQRSQTVRDQFQIQEQAIRREMTERSKQATSDADRNRLRTEAEQRIASLKAEAADAERQVMAACRG